jgi:ABC-type transport system involved in multi-copper enzyme maturation permease subunit
MVGIFRNISTGPNIKTGLRLAFRAGFGTLAIWFLVIFASVVVLAAQFSARQPATVALDVGFSLIHLLLPVYVVLLVQELITREFDRKLYLTTLTYPRPRSSWLLGRVLVIALILSTLLVVTGILLAVLVSYVGAFYAQATPVSLAYPYMVTLGFSALDLFVILAIGTFLAVITSTPSFVLIGTLGFVLIARSYMPIIQLLEGADYLVDKFADPKLYKSSLSFLNFVLPDLGTLDVRMIALYNKWEFLPAQWLLLAFSCASYAIALIGLAVWRLNKRELN